jgi:hypothetical protein
MRQLRKLLLAIALLCSSTLAGAQQPTVDLTEAFLNRLVRAMGAMSDAGVAQPHNIATSPDYEFCVPMGVISCSSPGRPELPGFGSTDIPLLACTRYGGVPSILPVGDPVPWQWWVSGPTITLASNSLKFTATVSTRVGTEWHQETRTVDARIQFDSASQSLKLKIEPFSVEVRSRSSSARLRIPAVDVAELYGIAIGLQPQSFAVPLPNGATRNLNGRITGASATYLPGVARVILNVGL